MTSTTSPRTDQDEVGWETAPTLIDGARTLQLTVGQCNLDYWFTAVAQGMLAGLANGHRPGTPVPGYMREPGPLRTALISELGFRGMAEEKAARAISFLVESAPDIPTMEFYATQLIDEARHARVFRGHISELGVSSREMQNVVRELSGPDIEAVIEPLERFAQPVRDARDFVGGVVLLTVLVEGVLAPAAELSERKWRMLDPAAAEIERGAGIDEIRHLTVGSSIIRNHLVAAPQEASRLRSLIDEGMEMWVKVPMLEVLRKREELFQEGMQQYASVVGDYEIWPGTRLLETTPGERVEKALTWSFEMQQERLTYMGLAPLPAADSDGAAD